MKIKDLIKELQAYNPEQEVFFTFPSKDFWRTQLAQTPHAFCSEQLVQWDEYHRSYALVDKEDDECIDELLETGVDVKEVLMIEGKAGK